MKTIVPQAKGTTQKSLLGVEWMISGGGGTQIWPIPRGAGHPDLAKT